MQWSARSRCSRWHVAIDWFAQRRCARCEHGNRQQSGDRDRCVRHRLVVWHRHSDRLHCCLRKCHRDGQDTRRLRHRMCAAAFVLLLCNQLISLCRRSWRAKHADCLAHSENQRNADLDWFDSLACVLPSHTLVSCSSGIEWRFTHHRFLRCRNPVSLLTFAAPLGYRIYSQQPSHYQIVAVVNTGSAATSYIVHGLVPGQSYGFAVQAINGESCGAGCVNRADCMLFFPQRSVWAQWVRKLVSTTKLFRILLVCVVARINES